MRTASRRNLESARALALLCTLSAAASAAGQTTPPYEVKNWDYPGDGNTNRLWVASAVGDFNADGIEEMALIKGAHKQVSILASPADKELEPLASLNVDLTNNQFIAMTAGDLDGNGRDELIVLRKVPAGSSEGNILVYAFDDDWVPTQTIEHQVAAGDQPWIGIAAADFDGSGDGNARADLVVLKASSTSQVSFFAWASNPARLTMSKQLTVPASVGTQNTWRGVAAGDIDGNGLPEVVAVRRATGTTNKDFVVIRNPAGSSPGWESFNYDGETTHYLWLGVALGEFNRKADGLEIAAHKTSHSYFVYQKYTIAGSPVRVIAGRDYSSSNQYEWTSISAGNLMLNDGVDELISVRQHPGTGSTPVTLAVYGDEVTSYNDKLWRLQAGDDFHFGSSFQWITRVATNKGRALDVNALKTYMDQNSIQTVTFFLGDGFENQANGTFPDPGTEYLALLKFLELLRTTNSGINVIVNFATPAQLAERPRNAATPADSPEIGSAELGGATDERTLFDGGPGAPEPQDFSSWFRLLGIIGNKYSNLVGIGFDDFNAELGKKFKPAYLGKLVKALRSRNEHIAFIPTVYYGVRSKDWARNYTDGFVFYTHNEKYTDDEHRKLIDPPDDDRPVDETGPDVYNMHGAIVLPESDIALGSGSVLEEFRDVHEWLDNPFKLLMLGIYAEPHSDSTTASTPFVTERLMVHARESQYFDGVTIYTHQDPATDIGKVVHDRFRSWSIGHRLYDTFDWQITGRAPVAWDLDKAANTNCTVEENGTGKWLKFTDNNASGAVGAEKRFSTPITSHGTVTFSFRQSALGSQKIQLKSGSTVAIELRAGDGSPNLTYIDRATQLPVQVKAFVLNRTYEVTIYLDVATNTMDIMVDGAVLADQVPFTTQVSSIDRIMFRSGTAAAGPNLTHYIDDVSIAPH